MRIFLLNLIHFVSDFLLTIKKETCNASNPVKVKFINEHVMRYTVESLDKNSKFVYGHRSLKPNSPLFCLTVYLARVSSEGFMHQVELGCAYIPPEGRLEVDLRTSYVKTNKLLRRKRAGEILDRGLILQINPPSVATGLRGTLDTSLGVRSPLYSVESLVTS